MKEFAGELLRFLFRPNFCIYKALLEIVCNIENFRDFLSSLSI